MKQNDHSKETRLICSKCGACASHPEDRIKGKCHHCGGDKTSVQVRNTKGQWIGE